MGLVEDGKSLNESPPLVRLSRRGRCSILVAGPDDRTLHDLGVLERTPRGKDT